MEDTTPRPTSHDSYTQTQTRHAARRTPHTTKPNKDTHHECPRPRSMRRHPRVPDVHAPIVHTHARRSSEKKKKKKTACVLPNVHHTMTLSRHPNACTVLQSSEHTPHTNRKRDPRVHRRAVTRRRDRPRRRRSAHDDSTRRRDERSEPGVEGGETVHERWFIRHGRHVRDSAVGQCVIRRDASGRIARVSI